MSLLSRLLLLLASHTESSGVNFLWLEEDLEWHVMKHNVRCKVLVVKETEGFINICTVCIFTHFWSDRELWQLCNVLLVTVYCAFEINCNLTLIVAVDSHFYCFLYRAQEEWTKLRESVPYVKLYRYNPKHLYLKLNGYGDNGQRKVWTSCISA